MDERVYMEVLVGLVKVARGTSLNPAELAIVEKAEDIVFLSDESCKWCGGKGVVSYGSVCPECSGRCLR
jgi:RecJ-like exonuclease